MEARLGSLHRLLLGLTSQVSAGRGMADSHHKVHGSYDPEKKEWVNLKELTPLWYMLYVARLFHEVTGKDLRGLDRFTGWIG